MNILKFAVCIVALINIEAKIIFIGPPLVPSVPRWSRKWVDIVPHAPPPPVAPPMSESLKI